MNKTCRWIENLLFFIGLQAISFFGKKYDLLLDETDLTISILTRAILGILFGLFFMKVFVLNTTFIGQSTSPVPKKTKLLCFFFIVAVGTAYEILVSYLGRYVSVEWKYFGRDFAAILCWLLIFAVTNKIATKKNTKKEWGCLSIFFLAVMGLTVWLDLQLLAEPQEILKKFTSESPYLKQFYRNLDFRFCVKAVLTDTLMGTFLITFSICTNTENLNNSEDLTSLQKSRNICVSLLRGFFLADLCALFLVVKILIVPTEVLFIHNGGQKSSTSSGFTNGEADYCITAEGVGGVRKNGQLDFSAFRKVTVVLSKPGSPSETFILNGSEPNFILNGLEETEANPFVSLKTAENSICLYGYYAFSLYENGKLQIIRIESIGKREENPALTSSLEKLIKDGNLFAFEYGVQYLLKYHPTFIEPYIEQYAAGDFTPSELKWLDKAFVKREYIRDIAKSHSQK